MKYKEKEQLIRYIFNKRNQLLLYEKYVCEKEYKEYSSADLFLRWVQYALNSCSKEGRLILEKEFILYERKDWWYNYYSRSSYYRFKQRAMDEFLDCLHEQKMINF